MKSIDLRSVIAEPLQGHTSKGDQPKWQQSGMWYKADHMGYEALSEVIVSRLLEQSNVREFVRYTPVKILTAGKTVLGCASDNFKGPKEMLVPLERLHRAYHGQGLAARIASMETTEQIAYTAAFVETVTGLKNVGEYLTMILELDAFFLNEDRHTNNLAVLRDEQAKTFRLCPLFDHGLSLLSDLNDYPLQEDVFSCISRVRAKPFSEDFDEQMSAAEALYGQQLHFSFGRRDLTDTVFALSEIYPEEILRRVETVLLEQFRKKPIFF